MEKQNEKFFPKGSIFTEWVFFCVYWGVFAITWHFATQIETNVPNVSILHEARIITHFFAILFYCFGALLILGNSRRTISRSPEPSDKQPQSQT